jgi:hypothetical protein
MGTLEMLISTTKLATTIVFVRLLAYLCNRNQGTWEAPRQGPSRQGTSGRNGGNISLNI